MVQRFGTSPQHKQRFKCTVCAKTFIRSNKLNKQHRAKAWFKLWVYDGYTMAELSQRSGYSVCKIKHIIYYWLRKTPLDHARPLRDIKYLVYDATYFHKDGCLAVVFNPVTQQIVTTLYCAKEGHHQVLGWLQDLQAQGLRPRYLSMDGEQGVMRAVKHLWPSIRLQRCLFHIQHEGCRWLRTYPPTEAGQVLRRLLRGLTGIRSVKEQQQFITSFTAWKRAYQDAVCALPQHLKATIDLKRTITLIDRALPDMFYYIHDPLVRSTSNIIEALHGRIKKAYRQHQGLTHTHKIQFLQWYCYYENQHKTHII